MVESWRIVGYENRITSDESFTQARREFAEIPAGAATTVFYELELTNTALPAAMPGWERSAVGNPRYWRVQPPAHQLSSAKET